MKKIVYLLLAVTIFSGIFLRFYGNSWIYTDYDDVGVIALHKVLNTPTKDIKLYSNQILDVNLTIKSQGIANNLLDSPIFPFYIGFGWTYPIGQYFIHPLIIDEKDSFETKMVISRSISGFFGSLGLVLFLLLLYELNERRVDEKLLLPIIVVAMSANAVLYSHHSSPYSTNMTTLIASMLLFIYYLKDRLGATKFMLALYLLTIYNYLIILTIPVYIFLSFWLKNNKKAFLTLKEYTAGAMLYAVMFLPIFLVFMKTGAGAKGVMSPDVFGVDYLCHLASQFFVVLKSLIAGIVINDTANIVASILVFCGMLYFFILDKTRASPLHVLLYFSLLFILEWVVLHALKKLPMDETRHLVIWLPLIGLWVFYMVKNLKIDRAVLLSASVFLLGIGVYTNILILNEKRDNFDYQSINDSTIDTVLTYGFDLMPLVAFEGSKKVYNIDVPSFSKSLDTLNLPRELLLVSQDFSLEHYKKEYGSLAEMNKRFFEKYDTLPITQKESKVCFTYNNYCISSQKNGFYLYKMTKKDSVE